MIPEQLVLKNFLSYREASLDFLGLQTACICGVNGAGKSSLLEAMAWSVWGKSRATAEDDVIYAGEKEARVSFTFRFGREIYRIIRSRRLGQSTTLEFQMAIDQGDRDQWTFRSLTERGVKATQAAIVHRLRLDYETFVNSAYLRQGRADEFMLKGPAERKQILADLLKLSQYDELAEQAKDRAKTLKIATQQLWELIGSQETKLTDRDRLFQENQTVEAALGELRNQQKTIEQNLEQARASDVQRQSDLQQLSWTQQQQVTNTQELQRLQRETQDLDRRQSEVNRVLAQAAAIEAGAARLQQWQLAEEHLSQKAQHHHQLATQKNTLQQQLDRETNRLENEQKTITARLEDLAIQEREQQAILSQKEEVEASLAQLQQARSTLEHIEQLQAQAAPITKRQQAIEQTCQQAQTRLLAKEEELARTQQHLEAQLAREAQLQTHWQQLEAQIQALQNRKVYQERVQEKGTERKSFIDRLNGMKIDLENQLHKLREKSQLLADHQHLHGADDRAVDADQFGACPLCDRPLDQHHLELVKTKQAAEEKALRDRLWVLQEQLALTEREIQILRQEYRDLQQELKPLNSCIEERGKLQEQLQSLETDRQSLVHILTEQDRIQQVLDWIAGHGDQPANIPESSRQLPALLQELAALNSQLAALNFDDRNLSLARAEVDRWRWVEMRHHELQQSQTKLDRLQQRRPELISESARLQTSLQALHDRTNPQSILAQIQQLEQQLSQVNYQHSDHEALRSQIRSEQGWLARAEELRQCQLEVPQLSDRRQRLQQALNHAQQAGETLTRQLAQLQQQLADRPDQRSHIEALEQQITTIRQSIETSIARKAQLEQQQIYLASLEQQLVSDRAQLTQQQRQQQIYEELAKAFGKNGIQALAIETLLPQLEAEANRILSQLSANQLHINFITQRLKKSATKRQKTAEAIASATIETLEIQIADVRGTRPYETYSGGEAFRINFAIRLALSRLLTQRSGTALQLLIIDEGFGTQDDGGRDRLVAAINAIAPEFGCILTVTHIPQLKEAFSARIEVQKTNDGSKLSVLI
ncbi:MAG: ATP-binding cassette family protein [Oscillatoriales cyanobacterium]|nr:MAG: ATP-binding cassette family protein [Oscillatoriales cyanobacterium]